MVSRSPAKPPDGSLGVQRREVRPSPHRAPQQAELLSPAKRVPGELVGRLESCLVHRLAYAGEGVRLGLGPS